MCLELGFAGKDPVPSGTPILAEVVETYTLLSEALIEPEKRVQDAVANRFVMSITKDGAPTLRAVTNGLGLELPLRMSRTFAPTELVEGLIQVGFYHENRKIEVAGELIGAAGGSTTRDGITAGFAEGAFAAATLVKVQADPADAWASLWPELQDKGALAASFTVDVAGTLAKGMTLAFADLGTVPAGITPILVQRRTIADQRVVVAVGALVQDAGAWKLSLPDESNPILEGGPFAVVVPTQPWAWVTGVASIPQGLAQGLATKNPKARVAFSSPASPVSLLKKENAELTGMKGMKGISNQSNPAIIPVHSRTSPANASIPAGDVAVPDALVAGNFLQAASGSTGMFALPSFVPANGKLTIAGSRWDLGLTGALDVEVPSSSNPLRLTLVPFAITAVLPLEDALLEASAVFSVLTSTPMDPNALGGVKLFREDPNSTNVEINLHRQLSLDGRTLLLTPEGLLPQGATFVLGIDGLKSLAGETVPRIERHVTTAAPAPPPSECDFTRITLGYPDGAYNVPMTIPAGAIPAGASLLIEGTGMGFTWSGTMPNGELQLTIRAARGERIHLTVQIAGRTTEGYVSRYQANDGSGRVTIGADGGRVASSDGKVAATFPVGAFDRPIEVRAEFLADVPSELDPILAGQLAGPPVGQIRLWSKDLPELHQRPVLEFSLPASPLTAKCPDGLGPYGIYDRVEGFEEDGTPCVYFEYSDSAWVQDGRLRSFGGLVILAPPETPSVQGPLPPAIAALAGRQVRRTEMGPGRAVRRGQPAGVPNGFQTGVDSRPFLAVPDFTDLMERAFLWISGIPGGGAGDRFISGFAYRKMPSTLNPNTWFKKPVEGAFIFFNPAGTGTIKRNGRLLQRTGKEGSYILASNLTEELTRGGGEVMGQDPDFGVRAFTDASDFSAANDHGDRYCHPDPLVFTITAADQQDRIAPWAELKFEGADVLGEDVARYRGDQVMDAYAVVNAYDNRDQWNLPQAEFLVDGNAVGAPLVQTGRAGNAARWRAALVRLLPGSHAVETLVRDRNGNATRIQRTLHVLEFGDEPPSDPSNAPGFTLWVDGGTGAARSDTAVRVQFSQPVNGVSTASLVLEKLDGANWTDVPVRRLSNQGAMPLPGTVVPRTFVVQMVPEARLEAGATYRVRGTGAVRNVVDPFKSLAQDPVTFKVTSTKTLAEVAIPEGPIKRVAMLGSRTFVATPSRIYLVRTGDATPSTTPVAFGLSPTIGDFLGQEIVEMKAFRQVPMLGAVADLLLVTTAPRPGDENHQCALWAFCSCAALPAPNLLFGVSLGPGSAGYAPNLDCRGGYITVGRLSSSVAVISVDAAMRKWTSAEQQGLSLGSVVSPGGRNQEAILQPFWLANPEGSQLLTHPGVAMIPPQRDAAGALLPGLPITVGFPAPGFLRDGKSLRGLPSVVLNTDSNGALKVEPPFQPLSSAPAGQEPDARAYPGPLRDTAAATRVAVVLDLQVLEPDGTQRKTTLAVALTSVPSGFGGNTLRIMDEANPKDPRPKGQWPNGPLAADANGQALPYQIPYVAPSIDPITGHVAIPVQFPSTGKYAWYDLDLTRPRDPKTVATIDATSPWGSLYNGILSVGKVGTVNGSAVQIHKVQPGVAGVDDGTCELFQATVLVLTDPGASDQEGSSGLRIRDFRVRLDDGPEVALKDCTWLNVRTNDTATFVEPRSLDAQTTFQKLSLKFKSVPAGPHKVKLLGSDTAGNGVEFPGYLLESYWRNSPFEVTLHSDGR